MLAYDPGRALAIGSALITALAVGAACGSSSREHSVDPNLEPVVDAGPGDVAHDAVSQVPESGRPEVWDGASHPEAWTGSCRPYAWRAAAGRGHGFPHEHPNVQLTAVAGGMVLVGHADVLYDPMTDTWHKTEPHERRRGGAALTVLANKKTVLLTGGGFLDETSPSVLSDLYDIETRTLRLGPNMHAPRTKHVSVLMKNGKVLVLGGLSWSSGPDPMAEIYDPATDAFTASMFPDIGVTGVTAVELVDGRVLVVPSQVYDRVWIYDPEGDTWSTLHPPRVQRRVWAVGLPDGRVLVDGVQPQIFEPATGTWRDTGPAAGWVNGMPFYRPRVHVLPCGAVLVMSGDTDYERPDIRTTQLLYDIARDQWFKLAGDPPYRFTQYARSLLLDDGRVMLAFGYMEPSWQPSTLFFEPVSGGAE